MTNDQKHYGIKIGPFVKLREYLASNITPDVYANERGLKTK